MYQLGVGLGSATEQLLCESWNFHLNAGEGLIQAGHFGVFYPIPSGTRLTARVSKAGSNPQSVDVVYYGVS